MDFSDYQANALKFAVYKDKSYPFYALVEEVGEVFGKIAKAKRKGVEVDRAGLKAELGDVLWQISACAHELGVTELYPIFTKINEPDTIEDAEQHLITLNFWANEIAKSYLFGDTSRGDYIGFALDKLLSTAELYGWSLTEIMVANLYKLMDRKQRDVLVGEGDER